MLLRRLSAPAFLLLALGWTGCESSPVPLSAPTVPVDPALVGSWEMVTPEEDAGDLVEVFGFNGFEYLVEYREATRNEDGSVSHDDLQRLRMFVTDVDGRAFLNVRCIACDDDDGWLFVELERQAGGAARLTPVPDDIYRGLDESTTSETVLAALRELMRAPFEDVEVAVFRRVTG